MRNPIYPGAELHLLDGWERRRAAREGHRLFTGHTMAGTMAGTKAFFDVDDADPDDDIDGAFSHFGLAANGHFEQWMPIDRAAASDLEGNDYTISVEVEDKGPFFPQWSGSDVPAMTGNQVVVLRLFTRWLIQEDWIPPRIATTSCQRGLGFHRLGIDPWRNGSCPKFSSHRGKACPGDRRVKQYLEDIFPFAITAEPNTEDEDMFLLDCCLGDQPDEAGYLIGNGKPQKLNKDERDAYRRAGIRAVQRDYKDYLHIIDVGNRANS